MNAADLSAREKATILVEALPWLRRLRGAVVVIKHGGAALASEDASLAGFAEDVALLASVGLRPVVVHGGGPQIASWLARLGKTSTFVDGLRVTDSETLDIARMVLVGKVNRDLVGAINLHGPLAVGCSGEDMGMIHATRHPGDLGFVGEVSSVDPTLLRGLLDQGLIPVVATIGTDRSGQAYNINADVVAAAVAAALGAEKLVFLTDVEGIRAEPDDPSTLRSAISATELGVMLSSGKLQGGMIPKATSALRALEAGVASVHVLDGRLDHAILLEVFTDSGIGTMIRVDQGILADQGELS